MYLSTPILLILCGVLLVHVFPYIVSANISFTEGIRSVCGVSLIIGVFGGVNTETPTMVQKINSFWSQIPCLD